MAEEALMQSLCMVPYASEPGGDGGLSGAEDPLGRRWVEPFGKGRENHSDLMRGRFQAVQRGVASRTEGGTAGLTPKRLDPLSPAMLAISDEGMEGSVGVAEVDALLIGAGVALGLYTLGRSPSAFHLRPGAYRSMPWSSTQRGRGGETTGGTIVWSAGLEQTVKRAALSLYS